MVRVPIVIWVRTDLLCLEWVQKWMLASGKEWLMCWDQQCT